MNMPTPEEIRDDGGTMAEVWDALDREGRLDIPEELERARQWVRDDQVICGVCGERLKDEDVIAWLTGYGRIHESCIEEHLK